MLLFHKFIPAWGLPDLSPFCVKVETYLRMTDTAYDAQVADSRKAPKGKLPYIEDGGVVISDSRDIVAHLEAKGERRLDEGITPEHRAIAVAFRGLLEEEFYYLAVCQRWKQDEGWATYLPTMKAYGLQIGVPGFLARPIFGSVRRKIVAGLHSQGAGRHTPEQVDARASEIVDALGVQLGDNPYFLGDQPRTIDATVYAFVSALLHAPFKSQCRRRARGHANLVAYADRMAGAYFSGGS